MRFLKLNWFIGTGWAGALMVGSLFAEAENPPSWNELQQHHIPQWLEEAKFGIYTHWGLQSVKRLPGNEKLSYREAIPRFTAENFDPEAWADLFQAAGADFAGPVSWHGSGYVHWDSAITPWNSKAMSPHRDILGELAPAIKARGMKLLASFHVGYHYGFPHWSGDPEYTNPDYVGLYGEIHDLEPVNLLRNGGKNSEDQRRRSAAFEDRIVALKSEAVAKYGVDLTWVDTSFGGTTRPYNRGRYQSGKVLPDKDIMVPGMSERAQRRFIGNVFASGAARGAEVGFVYKTWDVPPGIGMRDVENGLLTGLQYDPWMTDIDMNIHDKEHTWFYQTGSPLKDANYLIDQLVDVVSKNGRVLLNVPPMADGSFSPEIERTLRAMGDWLRINREAIHGASPWVSYGEGPSEVKEGHYSDSPADNHLGAGDIRYTVHGEYLYATFLAWPGETAVMRALGSRGRIQEGEILTVSLLATGEPVPWVHHADHLEVKLPAAPVGKYAHVLKIKLR